MLPTQDAPLEPRPDEVAPIHCGVLRLELAAFRLRFGDQSVPLTYSEARILAALFQAADAVVSRDSLMPLLLTGSANEHALTAAMSRVRRVLRILGFEANLTSVRGQGYMLRTPIGEPAFEAGSARFPADESRRTSFRQDQLGR
ncbi:winged helix-turn-helix domain-containing protein [Sphingomonas sp. LHG3406-1]|uniref:winged helix-turn-helix domain-containing protein n=1 Tax=Sphingomonas sp. LHG3406-1 TaxID=2804617 RepID=UPI00260D1F7B|nr:winged helix-turn-helix domain-containing protein [Sphingomonas sp. LHG3406-1]